MRNILSERFSLLTATFLICTLILSVLSNVAFASPLVTSLSPRVDTIDDNSLTIASLDGDNDHKNSNSNSNSKGKGNGANGSDNDSGDKKSGESENNKQHGKLKIKDKHNGGSVQIRDEADDNNNENNPSENTKDVEDVQPADGNDADSQLFPADFLLNATGGRVVERGQNHPKDNTREASLDLSASTIGLEGNHVRVNIEGTITLDGKKFEITNGHGIIIFFKNPGKQYFRGIIHLVGSVADNQDSSEQDLRLRAFLLPPENDGDDTSWTFIVAPAAKLGPKIRITGLVGELVELDGSETTPLPDHKLDHFTVSTISSPIAAGSFFNITVSAVDVQGKVLKDFDGKVRITDLTGTVKPGTISNFNDGLFRGQLNITKAIASDKLTITDTATGKKGTSNTFNVFASVLAKVDLTPSAVVIQPAQSTKFVAKGYDKFGNELSGLNFTWSLSSSEFGSIATNGNKANFTASSTVSTSVNVTLTAKVGNIDDKSKISISQVVDGLDRFVIDSISSPKIAGSSFTITIRAINSTGATVTTYNGSMKLNDTTGSFNASINGAFVNGVWTGYVNITKAASNVKITARDNADSSIKGASNAFDVTPGSFTKLELNPSSITIQPSEKASFIANGLDKFGNEVAGLSFTWSLSSSDSGSIITSSNKANFTASSSITTEVNVTLTVKAEAITDSAKITVQPTALQSLDHFVLSTVTSPQKVGSPFELSITAIGSSGNTITPYNGHLVLNDTTGTLHIITDNGISNGTWTGTVMITKASLNAKIAVNDKENSSKKGISNTFDVKAGSIDHFEITGIGNIQTAGEEFAFTSIALDKFGNIIQDYNGTVVLSTNDGISPSSNEPELSPTPYTFNSDDEGQHTFQAKLYNAKENVSITIADSGKSGTSHAFKVQPSDLAQVSISPDSVSVTKGKKATFHAEAADAFGNAMPDETFAWNLSSLSLGSLSANSGQAIDFTATTTISEPLTGSITVTAESITDTATITVTLT